MESYQNTIDKFVKDFSSFEESFQNLENKTWKDVVHENNFENKIILDKTQMLDMKMKEIYEWYENKYDDIESKMKELKKESEYKDNLFKQIDFMIEKLKDIYEKRNAMIWADNTNINNMSILLNKISDKLISYDYNEAENLKRQVEQIEHKTPLKTYMYNRLFDNDYLTKYLSTWSGMKYSEVIYDSDKHGINKEVFRNHVKNERFLCFMVFDSDYNVYCHYSGSFSLYGTSKNKLLFMSLTRNDKEMKKYELDSDMMNIHVNDSDESEYYYCGSDGNKYFGVNDFGENNSYFNNVDIFKDIVFTETSEGNDIKFTTKRLIVIKMK